MTDNDELILTLLAFVDARFQPYRNRAEGGDEFAAPASVWQARVAYLEGGVELPARGGDIATRKAQERRRTDAQSAGLVKICRPSRRYTGLKLTDLGEARARASVGLPRLHKSRPLLERIRWLTTTPEGKAAGGGWECAVLDMDYDPDGCGWAFVNLGDDLLPGLVRGWISSNADCHGRVAYGLGPNRGEMPAELPDSLVFTFREDELPPQLEAERIYWDARDAERDRLLSTPPPNRNDIVIPLSAGLWPAVTFSKTAPTRAEVDAMET